MLVHSLAQGVCFALLFPEFAAAPTSPGPTLAIDNTIAIIANTAMPDDESHGLGIYFPEDKKLYNQFIVRGGVQSPYEEVQFTQNTSWDEFLKTYLEI